MGPYVFFTRFGINLSSAVDPGLVMTCCDKDSVYVVVYEQVLGPE